MLHQRRLKLMLARFAATTGLFVLALILLVFVTTAGAQPAPWQTERGYENGIPIGTKITQTIGRNISSSCLRA